MQPTKMPVSVKYQGFFCPISNMIQDVFRLIDPQIRPICLLVGVPISSEISLIHSPETNEPWVIQSDDDPQNALVSDVTDKYPELDGLMDTEIYNRKKRESKERDQKENILTTDQSMLYNENVALASAILSILQNHFPSKTAFYSSDFHSGYSEFFVCLLEKEQFQIHENLLIHTWGEIFNTFIKRPRNPSSPIVVLDRRDQVDPEVVLKNAGNSMLRKITSDLFFDPSETYRIFDSIQKLAQTPYEKKTCSGLLVLGNRSTSVSLRADIKISQVRMVRKLLEATQKDSALVMSRFGIEGFAKKEDPQKATGYSIQINGSSSWSLSHEGQILFQMEGGNLRTPRSRNEKSRFRKAFENSQVYFAEKHLLFIFNEIIQTLLKQSHGSILIISNKARDEAHRLRQNAIVLNEGLLLTQELVKSFSLVDGAILVDPSGKCYAFGAIMDGVSNPNYGEPERGSRYNSTLRYIVTQQDEGNKCMALVRSDDGMSDYFPLEAKRKDNNKDQAKRAGAIPKSGSG